jgi:hypothetical protein
MERGRAFSGSASYPSNKTVHKRKEKTVMRTNFIKLSIVVAMVVLFTLSPAWSAENQSMMGGGGMGGTTTTMMGGGMTTTIPGGSGNTTTTISRGGMGGGGMMGGSSRMGQFVTANLDNDINNIPEVVTIESGRTLVIMDNEGNVISSKPLPAIPELTNQRVMVSGLQVADMDGDGTPEIVTTYYVTNYGFMWGGTSTTSGTYLVILTNQGDLKDYKKLQLPY